MLGPKNTILLALCACASLVIAESAEARPNAARRGAAASKASAQGRAVRRAAPRSATRNAKAGARSRVSNKRVNSVPKHETHRSPPSARRNRATPGGAPVVRSKRPTKRPTARPKAAPSRARSTTRPTINVKTHNRTPTTARPNVKVGAKAKPVPPTPKFRSKSASRAKTKDRRFRAAAPKKR